MPMYNFDPGEEEEDDWETELLEECYSNHQRRVRITNLDWYVIYIISIEYFVLQQGYQSMDTEENAELFGNHWQSIYNSLLKSLYYLQLS